MSREIVAATAMSPSYRRFMWVVATIGPVIGTCFLYYHFFVKRAEAVFPTFYLSLVMLWLFAAGIGWTLRNSTPDRLAQRLRPVSGHVVQLNARRDGGIPVALVEFEFEGTKAVGGIRMNEIPRRTKIGDRLCLRVHPRMAKRTWPELFYMPELDGGEKRGAIS